MTPESLLALLRSHQDGVYTVCFHVLRNAHDAEDAAQEALLKVASGAKDLREPRAFKSWLYRLVYRTAVDHLRRRDSRRRIEEGSAAMPVAPLPDESRDAIHEAMAALPDDERLMLIEHYFEKVPLVELGRREGVSDVAMGKRIGKARERLRRGLAGAGFTLGAPDVSSALESVTWLSAPSGLIGAAIVSKAALVAAGGIAVGTKSATTTSVLVTAVLLLILVPGSLWWVLRKTPTVADPLTTNDPTRDTLSSKSRDAAAVSTARDLPRPTSDAKRGDPAACRRALARFLPWVRTTDVTRWAGNLEALHGGLNRDFEALAREFLDAAGADLVPIVRTLLAETEAGTGKFLLAAILGRSSNPTAVEVLKTLASDGSSIPVVQSALYSMGLIRSPEGLAFLKSTWVRVGEKGGEISVAILKALGLFGSEGIPLLLEAAKDPKSSHFRDKSAYLFLVRGKDAADGLRNVIETETDGAIRRGAAQALALNLAPDQGEIVADLFSQYQDPGVRGALIFGLLVAWKLPYQGTSVTPTQSAIFDRMLTQAAFPTGTLDLDRALIWIAASASPEHAGTLIERFGSLDKDGVGPHFDQLLRELIGAYSGRKEFESRLSTLMSAAGITPEQSARMKSAGTPRASAEPTAVKEMVESLRQSTPGDPRLFHSLNDLVQAGAEDVAFSSGLKQVYDRCPTAETRAQLLESLNAVLYSKREAVPPLTFLQSILRESAEVDARVYAASTCLSGRSTVDLDPLAVERIAELVGPDMKWGRESSLATGNFRMVQVAPSIVGDYYSRYGKPSDIEWLRKLPDDFPYPPAIAGKQREILKASLAEESRRAIDAIRLRN